MSDVTTSGAPIDDPIDGRTARRDRNRDLVLDAVIELFTEDQLAPNASDVAERSGVSLRSVYRYFEDHDALVRAAIARHAERVTPLLNVPDMGKGPLDERIARFVDWRIRLYEAAAPTARVALLRAPANPLLRDQLERVRALLHSQIVAMFPRELAAMSAPQRRSVIATIDTLLQFESAEHLRVRLDFSAPQTVDILRRTLATLFSQ